MTTPSSDSITPTGKRIYDLHRLRNLLLSERIPAHVQPAGKEKYLHIQAENGYSNSIELHEDGEISLYTSAKPGSAWWKALRIIDQFLHAPPGEAVELRVGLAVKVINPGSVYHNFAGFIQEIDMNHHFPILVLLHHSARSQLIRERFKVEEIRFIHS